MEYVQQSVRCSMEEPRAGGEGGGTSQKSMGEQGPKYPADSLVGTYGTLHMSELSMQYPVGAITAVHNNASLPWYQTDCKK